MKTRKTAPAVTAEQMQEKIAEQVEQLRESGQWQRFLDLSTGFHAYSLSNLLLIAAQRPDATAVAGFRKWKEKGRQVRKGEKAIRIFGYRERTITEQDESTGEETTRRAVYFPVLSVFDIAQTDSTGDEATDQAALNLTSHLTGDTDHGVIDRLTAALAAAGWTVGVEPILWGAAGYTDPDTRRVVLAQGLAPEQHAKTLIHEAAHIELDHIADREAYRAHRGLMETEAESVAYVVAGMLGFDTAAYSIGYIAGWSHADTDLVRSTAQRVITAVRKIHARIAPANQSEPPHGRPRRYGRRSRIRECGMPTARAALATA